MSISMTWANYALTVVLFLLVYYSAVLIYFRKPASKDRVGFSPTDLAVATETAGEQDNASNSSFNLFGEKESDTVSSHEASFSLKSDEQTLINEIEAYTSAVGITVSKKEFIESLRNILQKYPSVYNAGARYELNQLIEMVSENNCSIHLSEDELDGLWNG